MMLLALLTIANKYGNVSVRIVKDLLALVALCLPQSNTFPKSYKQFIQVILILFCLIYVVFHIISTSKQKIRLL